jgi:23S rRNA (uridine2552-2'-O)-methyltransferase
MANRWADQYTKRAREAGYPARSVFKLEEIQARFAVLRRGGRVLDLGAAPGSWSQYALSRWGGIVTAVDLQDLDAAVVRQGGERLAFFKNDLFEPGLPAMLRSRGPFDTVLCDAAPSTTGARVADVTRSAALAERAIELAAALLTDGGCLVVKILQGGEERRLLDLIRAHFQKGRAFKPPASRKASTETYMIGLLREQKKLDGTGGGVHNERDPR